MIGWRMKVGGVDPMGTASLTSAGFSRARYAAGQSVSLPAIFGHRDTGYTSCPGNFGYQQMDDIRAAAKAKFDGGSVAPAPGANEQSGEGIPAIPGLPEAPAEATGTPAAPSEAIAQFISEGLPADPSQAVQSLFAPQS